MTRSFSYRRWIIAIVLLTASGALFAQTKIPTPQWNYLMPGDSLWVEMSLMKGDVLEWSLLVSRLAHESEQTTLVLSSDIDGEIWRRDFGREASQASDDLKIKKNARYRMMVFGRSEAGRPVQFSVWPRVGKKNRNPFPSPAAVRIAENFAVGDRFSVDYEFMLPSTTGFQELMEMELPSDLVRVWAITPDGDSLAASVSVKRWFGQPGKFVFGERAPRGGRLTLRLDLEIPVAGETTVHIAPGAAPPEWLPEKARVLTRHEHKPWQAVMIPPQAEHAASDTVAPIARSTYAAQGLRVSGIDSLIAAELAEVYVERDILSSKRWVRRDSVTGYDAEFLKSERAFLPPAFHMAVTLPLTEASMPAHATTIQWFVAGAIDDETSAKLYRWEFDEARLALPEAPDEFIWNPSAVPLAPGLRTFEPTGFDQPHDISLNLPAELRPFRFMVGTRTYLNFSRRVFALYLENASNDTLYLVYRQEAPIERSVMSIFSRWPKGARIAVLLMAIVGGFGIFAIYELRQRDRRRRKVAEEMAEELDKARQVQEKLLPQGPMEVKGIEVLGLHQSMQSVGGDYYDFFPMKDGRVLVCVADVAGHGLAAALLMSNLQATLHAISETPRPMKDMVALLNQEITKRTSPERFVTLLLAEISADRSQITFCNAGHNPGYIVRKNGKIIELDAGGIMLGVMDMFPYIEMDYGLEPGDLIALYTDGIPEAEIGFEDMFGYDRLQYFLSEHRDEKLVDIAQELLYRVTTDNQTAIEDDMAIVLIRVKF